MADCRNFNLKYFLIYSLLFAAISVAYFKFEEITQVIARKCEEAAPQVIQKENKRLKYWHISIDNWNKNGNLRSMNRVFEKLDYEFVNATEGDEWDILWSKEFPFDYHEGGPIKPLDQPLKPHQKVNHFPGNVDLVGKSRMCTRNKDLKYILPPFRQDAADELKKYIAENPKKKFVIKNKYNRGVRIVNASDIDVNVPDTFHQVFLDNPFLVHGRAMDMGIFVLITSVNPLRAYRFNEEVLLRFCAEDYYPFDETNKRKYVVDDSHTPTYEMEYFKDAYKNYKFTFKSLLEDYIAEKGFDVQKMWADVDDAIASILLNTEKPMVREVS
jgi:hypothetical protein